MAVAVNPAFANEAPTFVPFNSPIFATTSGVTTGASLTASMVVRVPDVMSEDGGTFDVTPGDLRPGMLQRPKG